MYQELNEQLEVFTVGVDGAVRGIYKAHNGPWQPPFTLTDAGLALPGAHVAASAIHRTISWKSSWSIAVVGSCVISKAKNGAWKPASGLREGFAAPGAPLAVVYQPLYEQLEVFAVAGDGSVHGLWMAQNSYWSEQFSPAPAGFAPPSANIAGVFYPSNNQLEVFVVDRQRHVECHLESPEWRVASASGLASQFRRTGRAAGGGLSARYDTDAQLEVFAVTDNGSVHGLWKFNNADWQPQFSLGQRRLRVCQSAHHGDVLPGPERAGGDHDRFSHQFEAGVEAQ